MPDHEIATREDWVTARQAGGRVAPVRRNDEYEDAGA
jgi:hypothetical protein